MQPPLRSPSAEIRLAEPLAALSLVSDLARGRPPEEAMRACLVATSLARSMGLPEPAVADVYYTALLRSVGCTATSHEYAALYGGDDVVARSRGDLIDPTSPREALVYLWGAPTRTRADRVRAFARSARIAKRAFAAGSLADCEIGARMARQFGLGAGIQAALLEVFERWDGKGLPHGVAGSQIALPARFAAVAYAFVMFEDDQPGRGVEVVGMWAGHGLDPEIAAEVTGHSDRTLAAAREDDMWLAVVNAEPAPARRASEQDLDELCRSFARVVDLKSPYLHGHSTGVASLAETAAAAIGLDSEQVTAVRRAALLHDLGRTGIPTGIWEKPGPLTTDEWEQVRLHAYHSERILSRCPALAPLARLAGMHHERVDSSGYHRGAPAGMQTVAMRVLAAADVYQALTEDRPHRAALSPQEAARVLETAPLDGEAVRAVVRAAGQTARRGHARPAGITERELEVIRRLVRGRSEKEIAAELVISAATVHSHVAHIYEKTGVQTRAGLAMFAMEQDLIRPGEPAPPDAKID